MDGRDPSNYDISANPEIPDDLEESDDEEEHRENDPNDFSPVSQKLKRVLKKNEGNNTAKRCDCVYLVYFVSVVYSYVQIEE